MGTMKMIIKWVILFLVFFLLVEFMTFAFIASTYQEKPYVIKQEPLSVSVEKSEATYVNGKLKGKVTNTGSEYIADRYIIAECYSGYNNLLGSVYVSVNDLKPNDTKEFELKYRYDKVDHLAVYTTDKMPENSVEKIQKTLDNSDQFTMLLAGVFLLYFLG